MFFRAGMSVLGTVIIYSIDGKGGRADACEFKWLPWVLLGGFMLLSRHLVVTRGGLSCDV